MECPQMYALPSSGIVSPACITNSPHVGHATGLSIEEVLWNKDWWSAPDGEDGEASTGLGKEVGQQAIRHASKKAGRQAMGHASKKAGRQASQPKSTKCAWSAADSPTSSETNEACSEVATCRKLFM